MKWRRQLIYDVKSFFRDARGRRIGIRRLPVYWLHDRRLPADEQPVGEHPTRPRAGSNVHDSTKFDRARGEIR